MDEIEKIRLFYKLKTIKRGIRVEDRFETDPEHVYSTLVLLDYLKPLIEQEFNEMHVMKLIVYHDLVELYAGDTFFTDEIGNSTKKQREKDSFERIQKEIPDSMKFILDYIEEYEKNETMEAQVAHAIDTIDPMIQVYHDKELFDEQQITERVMREKKEKKLAQFPKLKDFSHNIIEHWKEKGYFFEQ